MNFSIPDLCKWTALQHDLFFIGVLAAIAIGYLACSQADFVHLRAVGRAIESIRAKSPNVHPLGKGVRLKAVGWTSTGVAILLGAGALAGWHGVSLLVCRAAVVPPTSQIKTVACDGIGALMAFGIAWIRVSSAIMQSGGQRAHERLDHEQAGADRLADHEARNTRRDLDRSR